jgi:hypothetical protein
MTPNGLMSDGESPGPEHEEWVVTCWHAVMWHVQLMFVVEKDGRPRTDWHACSAPLNAYRWRSYHAAAKWLREHAKELPGYTVRNLTEILRDGKVARERP